MGQTPSSPEPAPSRPSRPSQPAPTQSRPSQPSSGDVVVRRNINSMSATEQNRWADAVQKMMENTNGSQSSEFFRIAGYHGWPDNFCAHGQEHFPAWHRAYLVEFERALQAADRALGRDGNIGLPYWDWTRDSSALPPILRQRFSTMPSGLVTDRNELSRDGYSRVPSDRQIARDIRSANLAEGVNGALREEEHWRFASTRWRQPTNVESPHNQVHVILGFPMASVGFAAFYPGFWLHHCNIDRILSKYLELEPDSEQEMRQQQASLQQNNGERNRYTAPLRPFRLNGRSFRVSDTFSDQALGYRYDVLPATPPQQMRSLPTFAKFTINILEMQDHSYTLHVFVLPKGTAAAWAPPADRSTWADDPAFAGVGAIFSARRARCENCEDRPPFDVYIEITQVLQRAGLSRYDCAVRVMTVDENDAVARLEDTPVPAPTIEGPFFENKEAPLKRGSTDGDTKQLQKYLIKFGWLTADADGQYGPVTEEAVKKFQRFVGLTPDGVAGTVTKGKLGLPRMDTVPDQPDDPDVANYQKGQTVKYWVGPEPGYMNRDGVVEEIKQAFAAWAEATGVKFQEVRRKCAAHVRVSWGDKSPDNLFSFDGKGGALAHSTKDYLQFDAAERWLLRGQNSAPGRFFLYPVALHEIGHVLGFTHSSNPADVMAPFYVGDRVDLQPGDLARCTALYGAQEAVVEGKWKWVAGGVAVAGAGVLGVAKLLKSASCNA
ncbi:unnamed protein product [Ostreobium quekettii]|uniref:Tyrosinase copper-binding domain-containing protein n=1 Tax=Ostreobium quekettii TaxID=121088 RepID=A0A8S1J8N1_9CHLO|nr:unnamed protein product [Ostreobium quekettii]|eukprot:evm.model.scf_1192EXC.5 EVM.evm.TU.scf_1192EXC.5   scf_1192EXC:37853-41350(+)